MCATRRLAARRLSGVSVGFELEVPAGDSSGGYVQALQAADASAVASLLQAEVSEQGLLSDLQEADPAVDLAAVTADMGPVLVDFRVRERASGN